MPDYHCHSRCRRVLALLGILFFAIHGFIAAQVAYPLPGVELTLNEKVKLEFCIVSLNIGDAPFATREFWLGGRGKGGFKEPPTRTLISGSTIMQVGGKPDWCLLIGKTEVTVAQWNAVMGLAEAPEAEANLPVTRKSKAEILLFLEKLNAALYAKGTKAAFASGVPGSFDHIFIRLPFETEWEFAARGGLAVDSARFDNPTPYTGELNRFEWVAGQHSSKGQLKPVGLLEPNPLGLHDMLGNAAEIVESFYQIEYSQGRFGGLVTRGGDFRTNEEDIRASLRFEAPCVFEDDGAAYRASHAGFRLASGSLVIPTVAAGKSLENSWAAHKEKRIQPATAVPGTAPLTEAVNNETEEMRQQVKELARKYEMSAANASASGAEITKLEALIASLEGKVKRAEELSSLSAIRLGSMTSLNVTRDITTLRINKENQNQEIVFLVEKKIANSKEVVVDSCKLLSEATPSIVKRQFDEWEQVLKERGADTQLEATRVFRKAAFEYTENRRLDLDSWYASLEMLESKIIRN